MVGNSDVIASTAEGVQNKLERIIFSSATLCSFRTATALETVFPVPVKQNLEMKCVF